MPTRSITVASPSLARYAEESCAPLQDGATAGAMDAPVRVFTKICMVQNPCAPPASVAETLGARPSTGPQADDAALVNPP